MTPAHTSHHDQANPGLEPLLAIGRRRMWVGLLSFIASSAVFVSLIIWLPALYRATATILVETPQVSEAFVRPAVTAELETRIQTIRQEVMSRSRLASLIVQLGLYPDLRSKNVPLDDLIERMRRDIDLDLKSGDAQVIVRGPTIAFSISYAGRDPEAVARVANVLASMYVEENSTIRAGQAATTAQVLKSQLDEAKAELDAQDRRASEFKLNHIGELPEQVSANLASIERLNTQLRLNSENQLRAMDRRERLEKQLAELPSTPAPAAPARPRDERLVKLRQDLADMSRQYSAEYPDVKQLRAEIAELELQDAQRAVPVAAAASAPSLAARLAQDINDAAAELAALRQEEVVLRQSIDRYEQRVENVPKRHDELQSLSRDYEATKERYNTLRKRYEDAQLAESLEQGRKMEQFRLLDPAVPPRQPFAPSRLRLLLLGLLVSLGFAASAMFVAERLDTSLHGIEDLRGFVRIPALFSIPVITSAEATRRQRRRAVIVAVSAVAAVMVIVAGVRHVAAGNERIVRMVASGRA